MTEKQKKELIQLIHHSTIHQIFRDAKVRKYDVDIVFSLISQVGIDYVLGSKLGIDYNSIDKECETCVSYEEQRCTDHKGHYCIHNDSMEDRYVRKIKNDYTRRS